MLCAVVMLLAGTACGVVVRAVCALGRHRRPGESHHGVPRSVPLCLGVAWMLLAARFGGAPAVLPAHLALSVPLAALAAIDVDVRRLPDALTLPLYPLTAVLLVLSSIVGGSTGNLPWAVVGCLAALLGFLALAVLAPPGGLGLGDVKLAGALGLLLGSGGLLSLLTATAAAFGLAACAGAIALRRGATPNSQIPFGPFLITGALIGILLT